MRGLVGSQDGTNIHSSVPTSLYYLPTNLYTSVVDFLYVRRLVESALERIECSHKENWESEFHKG